MNKIVTALIILASLIGKAQNENSLLWKIEGNGLKTPSYLFGTIHATCSNELKITKRIKTALDASQQLVLETDMDEPDFMTRLEQGSVNPSMKNISTELSEKDLKIVNEFFKINYGADMSQLGIVKPFALMSMILMKYFKCSQPESYEAELMEYAKKHSWRVLGLEEVEVQTSFMDEVSLKQQFTWVVNYILEKEAISKSIEKTILAYKKEDIFELNKLFDLYPEYITLKGSILDKRNESWIPNIEKFASEKPTLFAVGAGHLAGDKGIINLLITRGYKVTPIYKN
ncbi:MAG: TraB/GumN family protein [Bacteroidota bacterium]|jgi:uncharacterized protein YbaP (TraB family)|nr:TraB/GumN family protein [Bacteroidota bacterium]MCA6442086.1 TraB/GumN family protein [Bacteroidota bacterium]